jgi:Queuine tRNA-ribosyltransferases, contain PUA domain
MLDVTGRSQRGRTCEYKRGDTAVKTPLIISSSEGSSDDPIYVKSTTEGRVLSVMGSEIELDQKLMTSLFSGIGSECRCKEGLCVLRLPVPEPLTIPDDVELVVIPNAFELRGNARRLIDTVIRVRKTAGYGKLICMLGIAEPSTVALLSYMGVDIFDDTLVKAAGAKGISLIPEGEVLTANDESVSNCSELRRECQKISTYIAAGRLRELVDQRAPSSPSSVAVLRIFDDIGYEYQEESCSTVGCRFACNTTQALRRPDLKIYREKIKERYVKPEHKRVLLLLPCSAKKPYHISKSHKAFASAIHTGPHETLVHEVIVTSPLGIVPRELDIFYPANSYDIPVTGEWKCQEKEMIRSMVSDILSQGYDKVICHLGKDAELVNDLAEMTETVVGDPTSPVSLSNLDEALRSATKDMEPLDYLIERRENMRSLLSFQFGKEGADVLMKDSYAIGKFPYWKLIWENPEKRTEKIQAGMLTPERGMLSLTLEGAEILSSTGYNLVEMTDFELKGNLFAVGVVKADPDIRIGDEAIITLNGRVMAVGVAMMSGTEMTELKRGIAVKIRHKVK